jgi:hypothetical protein
MARMKGLKIAYACIAAAVVIGVVVLVSRQQREDPVDVVFKRLRASVPRTKIVLAKQTRGGREPTFVGIILIDDETRQTLSWNTIGAIRTDNEEQREQVRRRVIHNFKDYPDLPGSNQIRSFDAYVGTIDDSPYFLSALITGTNAYLVLDHY